MLSVLCRVNGVYRVLHWKILYYSWNMWLSVQYIFGVKFCCFLEAPSSLYYSFMLEKREMWMYIYRKVLYVCKMFYMYVCIVCLKRECFVCMYTNEMKMLCMYVYVWNENILYVYYVWSKNVLYVCILVKSETILYKCAVYMNACICNICLKWECLQSTTLYLKSNLLIWVKILDI